MAGRIYEFTMGIEVHDEAAVRNAAHEVAIRDGVAESFDHTTASIEDCLTMIFAPSESAGLGCYITDSDTADVTEIFRSVHPHDG